jgi:hypothetical protein
VFQYEFNSETRDNFNTRYCSWPSSGLYKHFEITIKYNNRRIYLIIKFTLAKLIMLLTLLLFDLIFLLAIGSFFDTPNLFSAYFYISIFVFR